MSAPDTEVSKAEFRQKSIWRRLNDLVFGYDFFISYACSDGRRYAVGLAEQTETGNKVTLTSSSSPDVQLMREHPVSWAEFLRFGTHIISWGDGPR